MDNTLRSTTNPHNPIPIYPPVNTSFPEPTVEVKVGEGNPRMTVIAIDHLPTLVSISFFLVFVSPLTDQTKWPFFFHYFSYPEKPRNSSARTSSPRSSSSLRGRAPRSGRTPRTCSGRRWARPRPRTRRRGSRPKIIRLDVDNVRWDENRLAHKIWDSDVRNIVWDMRYHSETGRKLQ
jgi:hypothetical protein